MESADIAEQRPAWAWIDRAAVRHNAERALACAAGRSVIGVVKADGYGHGAVLVSRALLEAGVTRLAVVSVAEGRVLREAGVEAPILLLGGLDEAAGAERAAKWQLTPVLQDARGLALARAVGSAAMPLDVEIEIDTGMRRMGVGVGEAAALLAAASEAPEVEVTGLFTHLACSDEASAAPSLEQAAAFAKVVDAYRSRTAADPVCHVANSGGLFRLEEFEGPVGLATRAVRPGLMLYGVSPFVGPARPAGSGPASSDSVGGGGSAEALGLEPVMTLAAEVISVRRVSAGDTVGYGGEWRASRPTTIATLPLGYADGIPRAVAGRGRVFLSGAMRPIVGRVSMDSLCLDLGDDPVAVGDVATVFGRAPSGERVPVEDFAAAAGTIGYEILVGIGARVRRQPCDGRPPATPDRGVASAD